ncbi:MAG: divalent-cation tolerance protein CutA [Acidobacteria bacterium]|nr:divalent-cation tolerance protein CutA [Acidobacteriota bacterium]
MTDKVVVLVTCSSAEEAGRIAKALVEERLAACVNISSPIRSVYRWQGKVSDAEEVLLVIKTARELFDPVRRTVERLHSYQVPEVICLPVIDGAPNYLNWIGASVKPEPEAPVARSRPAGRKRK